MEKSINENREFFEIYKMIKNETDPEVINKKIKQYFYEKNNKSSKKEQLNDFIFIIIGLFVEPFILLAICAILY